MRNVQPLTLQGELQMITGGFEFDGRPRVDFPDAPVGLLDGLPFARLSDE